MGRAMSCYLRVMRAGLEQRRGERRGAGSVDGPVQDQCRVCWVDWRLADLGSGEWDVRERGGKALVWYAML